MSERLKALLAEYGRVAIGVYLVIFAATLIGFYLAITMGFEPEGVAASAGTLGASWLATKLTQPLRIGATLLITPVLGTWINKRKGKLQGTSGAPDAAPREDSQGDSAVGNQADGQETIARSG